VGRDSSVAIATTQQARRSVNRIPAAARYSARVHTDQGVYPASCTIDTGSFLGVKQPGHGNDHLPHLVPRLKSRAIPPLPLWAFMTCSRANVQVTPCLVIPLESEVKITTLTCFVLPDDLGARNIFLCCQIMHITKRCNLGTSLVHLVFTVKYGILFDLAY
jgi:hypothetical protein